MQPYLFLLYYLTLFKLHIPLTVDCGRCGTAQRQPVCCGNLFRFSSERKLDHQEAVEGRDQPAFPGGEDRGLSTIVAPARRLTGARCPTDLRRREGTTGWSASAGLGRVAELYEHGDCGRRDAIKAHTELCQTIDRPSTADDIQDGL